MQVYRVTMVVAHLGLVGIDLGRSPSRWAAAEAVPSTKVVGGKSKLTAITMVTPYHCSLNRFIYWSSFRMKLSHYDLALA